MACVMILIVIFDLERRRKRPARPARAAAVAAAAKTEKNFAANEDDNYNDDELDDLLAWQEVENPEK